MNINNLKASLETLKEALEKYAKNRDLELQSIFADSCVKRFEYTLETAIKLMRKVLKTEYLKDENDLTINNIFRIMNSYGFLRSWTTWKDYYKQRNNQAHEYNIEKSRELLSLIPNFICDCEFLTQKLDEKFQQEKYFQIISDILKEYDAEFFAYGSRVKGTFQANSDLDVMIIGNIDPDDLDQIKNEIDQSDVPFLVHFYNRLDMDNDFIESIKKDLLKL